MFGISLPKLIVLVAVVAAVWFGFKYVARIQDARKSDDRPARRGRRGAARRSDEKNDPAAMEMVQCPVCQDYVQARGASACDRANCPY